MPQIIPNIYKQIYVEDVLIELEDKYADIGPIWVKNQMEWNNNIYSSFKDHDKYMIIIYLIKKTLDFYSRNFTKLNMEDFYKDDMVEIERFNIIQISKDLNIPKESSRRKVFELEKKGIIKRSKNKCVVDRSAYQFVKPKNSVKRISRFLSILSEHLNKRKILEKKLTSEDLQKTIEQNFSYVWKLYYDMQIPMMLIYKNFFEDLESFHIWGTCVVNQHLFSKQNNKDSMNRKEFIKSLYTNNEMQGLNAMSISDITGIPRATVVRKLSKMIKKRYLSIDNKKHYKLTGFLIQKLVPLQNTVLVNLANFSTKVFNLSIL